MGQGPESVMSDSAAGAQMSVPQSLPLKPLLSDTGIDSRQNSRDQFPADGLVGEKTGKYWYQQSRSEAAKSGKSSKKQRREGK